MVLVKQVVNYHSTNRKKNRHESCKLYCFTFVFFRINEENTIRKKCKKFYQFFHAGKNIIKSL